MLEAGKKEHLSMPRKFVMPMQQEKYTTFKELPSNVKDKFLINTCKNKNVPLKL